MIPDLKTIWGGASAVLRQPRHLRFIDALVLMGLASVLYGLIYSAHQWTGEPRAAVEIDLSPWALPGYTFLSLLRGLLAYALSLVFTLVYGYWAAKDRVAERVLIPLLDILQSIPVLGFMPGLVLALVAAFPRSNLGLELAAVLMIFTGQAWNMTFSFYHSVSSVPADLREASACYRFSAWQRFRWIELPYSMIGLIWNSMMSMAGGWFFLMISEAFRLGQQDFRLPGVGSYMSVAVEQGRYDAMLWAMLAMVVMIVALDQFLWRPLVVWAQKFRLEEGGAAPEASSWVLDVLRHSQIALATFHFFGWLRRALLAGGGWWRRRARDKGARQREWMPWISLVLFLLLLAALTDGAVHLGQLLMRVRGPVWGATLIGAAATLGRVLLATALGTLWALPVGLAIGLSPRLSRIFQPIVQVVASFPAPMLYPLVTAIFVWLGVVLDWGSIVLMLLGTQWYILFNVIAGATAIPADMREAARSYRIEGWQRFRALYFPVVFPYLVTGWVTAAGGAWNASIVAEFVTFRGTELRATGLGAQISDAAADADFPRLAAAIVVMALMVVVFNRLVWRRCYRLAETRFSLVK